MLKPFDSKVAACVVFNQDKRRQDKTKKNANKICATNTKHVDAFFVLLTRNTPTYSSFFCPYASNDGVNLMFNFFILYFICPKCEVEVEVEEDDIQKGEEEIN